MGLKIGHVETTDKIVGANLRMFRTSIGLSQMALGEKVGITFQQIQKYERGSNRIGASRLWQFCEILKVKPNDFFKELLSDADLKKDEMSEHISLYQHPRGSIIARAFLAIGNPRIENAIIEMCRSVVLETKS